MESVPYFPIFFRLKGRKILVAGGGTIACRRIRTLLEFESEITVVSPCLHETLEELAAQGKISVRRTMADGIDFDGIFPAGALANNCSRKEDCDFYFPSIVRKDQTVIGINGGGQDHGKVRELRCRLERFLDAPGNY